MVSVDLVLGLVLALPHSSAAGAGSNSFRPHSCLSAYWALPYPGFWLAVLVLLRRPGCRPALMFFSLMVGSVGLWALPDQVLVGGVARFANSELLDLL